MGNCIAADSSNQNRNYMTQILESVFRSSSNSNSNHPTINQLMKSPKINNSHKNNVNGKLEQCSHNIHCNSYGNEKEPQKMICLEDFNSDGENELRARRGDQLIVYDINDPDWFLADRLSTKQRGYIPKSFVAAHPIEVEEWFFSRVRRQDAEKLLLSQNLSRGTFIVRYNEGRNGFSLSILDHAKDTPVKHYKIRSLDNGGYYVAARNTFKTVSDLVAFYSAGTNGLCCRLLKPCPKPKPIFWPHRGDEIQRNELKFECKIGTGYFGEVYFGHYRNVEVAVKTLKHGTMSPQAFLQEATIMRKYRHDKLVSLYGVCSKEEPLLIITEYMCNGSLLDYLRKDKDSKCLKFADLMYIAAQIADGMSFLEKMKLVHRDLAARNILVGENKTVKVADFGLARVLEDTYVAKHGSKFPVKWCALESALYGRFSEKSDVWSFGIVLYEIVTHGQIPYAGMQNKEVIDQIQAGYRMPKPLNCNCPDKVYDIMLKCWQADPDKRPTFEYLTMFFGDFPVTSEQSYRDAQDCHDCY